MSEKIYYTQAGLEEAKKELDILQTKGIKEISKQIEQALEQGDLSENAEFKAAKENQRLLAIKIAELQDKVARARVIDESKVNTSRVTILTTVKVKNHSTNKILKYKLVPAKEATKRGTLSVASPIAKGLLNKKPGDVVTIDIPAGKHTFEVLDISL